MRYFDDLIEPVAVKRWRCADCRAVHTLRPSSHWRRFWAAIATISACIERKLQGKIWDPSISRQRQQYWMRGYRRQSLFDGSPAASFAKLLRSAIVAVTHSLTDRAVIPWPQPPYPRFAATAPP